MKVSELSEELERLKMYNTATETTCANKHQTVQDRKSFGTHPFAGNFSLFSAVLLPSPHPSMEPVCFLSPYPLLIALLSPLKSSSVILKGWFANQSGPFQTQVMVPCTQNLTQEKSQIFQAPGSL